MRRLSLVVLLVGALLGVACEESAAPGGVSVRTSPGLDEVIADETALVGVLRDLASGEPVPGGRVWTEPASVSVLATAQGEFVLQGDAVRGGRTYRVWAEAAGYEPASVVVLARQGVVQRADLLLAAEGTLGAIRPLERTATLHKTTHLLPQRVMNAGATPSRVRVEIPAEATWLAATPPAEPLAPGATAEVRLALHAEDVYARWSSPEAPRLLSTTVELVDDAGGRTPLRVVATLGEEATLVFEEITDEKEQPDWFNRITTSAFARIDGEPLRYAEVELTLVRTTGQRVTRRAWTNGRGEISQEVLRGGGPVLPEQGFTMEGRLVAYGASAETGYFFGREGIWPASATLTQVTPDPLRPGQPVEVLLQILDEEGRPWPYPEEVTFVLYDDANQTVDRLEDQAVPAGGVWRHTVTPPALGSYRVDVNLPGQMVARLNLEVVAAERLPVALQLQLDYPGSDAGLGPEAGPEGGLTAALKLVDADGVGVEGWTVRADLEGFAEAEGLTDGDGELAPFTAQVPEAGPYTLRAQASHPDGRLGPEQIGRAHV